MRKLLSLFIVLLSSSIFTSSAYAGYPDIVALVNDQPITKYDFQSRRKMAIALNNIDVSDPAVSRKLSRDILNILIDEALLDQHMEKVSGKVTEQEVDDSITVIEQRNKMPKNGLKMFLKSKGVEMSSFRKQVKGELIKRNIVQALSGGVSVSPMELDVALIHSGNQVFDVEAWVFTSKNHDEKAQKQMHGLQKRFKGCDKVEDAMYAEFADAEKFDRKLHDLPVKTQAVVFDTKASSFSNLYSEGDKFKTVFVCRKESAVSSADLNKIKSFLSNKKMSQKAAKFFKDLRAKAYIKNMISG
ncbi:MAG: hypothetical protein COA94_01730 [Rickettsiales bacterium]|nr:MAG: hypothetical protein COA94_01730 [Rickettsiales bacterium]